MRALSTFEQAVTIREEPDRKCNPTYYTIYQFMSRCLMGSDPKQAEKYLIKYVNLSNQFQALQEALLNEDKRQAFDLFMKGFEAETEHEEEVDALEREYSWWLLIILVGSITVSVIAFRYYLKQRKKKRQTSLGQALRPRQPRYH